MTSRLAGLVSAAALAAGIGAIGFVQVASAGVAPIGAAPLTVVKTVSGPLPAGTTFTATIQCDDNIIETEGGSTDQATVTFDATGQPTSPDTVTFDDPGQCVVTETADGGATTTTYACEGTQPVESGGIGGQAVVDPEGPICTAAGPQADPIAVNIVFEDQAATITIANTFADPEPQAAPQVVAQPAFTG